MAMESITHKAEHIKKNMFRLFSVYQKILLVYTSKFVFVPVHSYSHKKGIYRINAIYALLICIINVNVLVQ